jgi:hypothetical protein
VLQKLWDSGIGMSAWLTGLCFEESSIDEGTTTRLWTREARKTLIDKTSARIVELGMYPSSYGYPLTLA